MSKSDLNAKSRRLLSAALSGDFTPLLEERVSELAARVDALEGKHPLQRFELGGQVVAEVHPGQWGAFDAAHGAEDGPYALGTLQQAATAALEAELASRPATKGGTR